jgi:uncharacterized protein
VTNLSNNRQTPRYGKLNAYGYDRGDFVFQVGKPDLPSTAPVPTPQPTSEAERAWAAAQGTTSQAALESFIRRYGDSFYGDLAGARLEELKKSQIAVVTPPVSTVPSDEAVVRECDRLAASRYDNPPAGVVSVDLEKIVPAQAVPACRAALAVLPDDPRINFQLGRALVVEDSPAAAAEAIRLFHKAADAGFTPAMMGVAFTYANGKGVAKDEAEAVRWYRKAADAGLPRGMSNLGDVYATGEGVTQDYAQAREWHEKAAAAGDAVAKADLERLSKSEQQQGKK